MRGTIFHIDRETAATPVNGDCITNSWWSCHPERGLAFYAVLRGYYRSDDGPSPQCNQSEWTSRKLTEKMYPDHEVVFMPVVFMGHANREMRRLMADARKSA